MANVNFSHDAPPPVDTVLEAIAQQAAVDGKPVRMRLQPDLYDTEKNSYKTWIGLVWTVELADVEEGRRLREGLTDFFRAFGGEGKAQARVLAALRGFRPAVAVVVQAEQD